MHFSLKSLIAALGLTAGTAFAATPLPVVASFSILGDVAQQIGGERISVQNIVGPDQDPHVYQATPADMRKIRAARLVLLNGLGFEGAAITRAVKNSKVATAIATQGITPAQMQDDGHDHASPDPHVWNDPALMQRYAANVAEALIAADPEGRPYYSQRLADCQKTLQGLDVWAAQQFSSVPVAQRKVLTGHDAFGYLGRRYQIEFIAPQGVSTEGEASAKTVAKIIQQVKRERIKAVFVENIRDPRLVQQLAREVGVQAQSAPLYSDALSTPQGPASTYVKLVRYNIGQLVQAMR